MNNKKQSRRPDYGLKYRSATEIGLEFGLSAIRVGQFFDEIGLRDPTSHQSTKQALGEGIAVATPMRDGTPHFMWHYKKVLPCLEARFSRLTELDAGRLENQRAVRRAVRDLQAIIEAQEQMIEDGFDKFAYLDFEENIYALPDDIYIEVLSKVFREEAPTWIANEQARRITVDARRERRAQRRRMKTRR